MKEIINVTAISEYLYCPRKLFLKKIGGKREPPNKRMIIGKIRHDILDLFGKNESLLVSEIRERKGKEDIKKMYESLIRDIAGEVFYRNENLIDSFKIDKKELLAFLLKDLQEEIKIRVDSVLATLSLGYLGIDLWKNLKPKYITELSVISDELGLRGRIDRTKISDGIVPYEIKTKQEIYDTDIIQLSAYALLLEERFNVKINRGILQLTTGENVIEITDENKKKVLMLADEIRNLKTPPQLPSSFKKCENCSFREECFEL